MGKPVANVFIGEEKVGSVEFLRGRYVFDPAWDAGENVPQRFSTPTGLEMREQLAQRGLRVVTAAAEIAAYLENAWIPKNTGAKSDEPEAIFDELDRDGLKKKKELHAPQDPSPPVQNWWALNSKKTSHVPADRLSVILQAEEALTKFWQSLTPHKRQEYLKAHPKSRFAGAPVSSIRDYLEGTGWKRRGKGWVHPQSGRRLERHNSDTHRFHVSVEHPGGDVTHHKTDSPRRLRRIISGVARLPKEA